MKSITFIGLNLGLFLYIMMVGGLLVTIRWFPEFGVFPWNAIVEATLQRYLAELQELPNFIAFFALPSFFFSWLRLRELSEHDKT